MVSIILLSISLTNICPPRSPMLNLCQRAYRVMSTQVTELSEEESSRMAMDF